MRPWEEIPQQVSQHIYYFGHGDVDHIPNKGPSCWITLLVCVWIIHQLYWSWLWGFIWYGAVSLHRHQGTSVRSALFALHAHTEHSPDTIWPLPIIPNYRSYHVLGIERFACAAWGTAMARPLRRCIQITWIRLPASPPIVFDASRQYIADQIVITWSGQART